MKYIIVILVVAGVAYIGWLRLERNIQPHSPAVAETAESPAPTAPPAPEPPPPVVIAPPPPLIPEPEPEPTPTAPEKHLAPDGVYYVLQRISITTDSGVVGVSPGTKVTMVKPGPPMRVTDGQHEFEVAASKLTNDLDIAAQVYEVDSQQRAATAVAREERVRIGQGQELEKRAEATASMDAASKKLEAQAQLQAQMQRQQAEARAAEQNKAPDRVVTRATPHPTPVHRRK